MPRSALSRPLLLALLLIAVGLAAFFAGRGSVHSREPATAPGRYEAGYLAGREAAFGEYDGGWGYGEPYIVVLDRGGPRITYAIAQRWPMLSGLEYRACGKTVCSRRVQR